MKWILVLMVGLGAMGCSDDSVSATCLNAMERAAEESDVKAADPLIIATLNACESPEDWLEALREYPSAMGAADAESVGGIDLEVACDGNQQTVVCSKR